MVDAARSGEALTYVFGRCEVRVATRALLVDGVERPVAPKVYDVLVHLLANRHRAVSKDELTAHVWHGARLSGSVLARTVMLVRRHIHDDAEQPVWIQSLHGFGYRFVGSVSVLDTQPGAVSERPAGAAVPAAPPDPSAAVQRPRRVGLLAIEDRTGNPQLAWARVGLVAIVVHSLQGHAGLSVQQVTAELDGEPGRGQGSVASLARTARELLGLDFVVHTVLRSQEDVLWMDFEILADAPPHAVGSLRDPDILSLAARLAQAIAAHTSGSGDYITSLVSTDPFVNQAFARGMAFADVQEWESAVACLDVARILQPSLQLQLEHARAQLWTQNPKVVERAEVILQRLGAEHGPILHARAHDLMALALQMHSRPHASERIVAHRKRALECCEGQLPSDWTISIRVNCGNYALDRGLYAEAREHLQRAEAEARSLGNQMKIALALQNCAVADRAEGEHFRALRRLEEALQIWRRLPKRPMRAHVLAQMAHINLGFGLLDEARLRIDEAVTCMDLSSVQGYDRVTASSLCMLDLELGLAAEMREIARKVGIRDGEPQAGRAPDLVIAASVAQADGHVDRARRLYWSAIDASESWPGVNFRRSVLLALAQLEMAVGTVATMARVRFAIEQSERQVAQPDLRAAQGRLQAASLHLAGDQQAALSVLTALVAETPAGRLSNWTRVDAAWLHLELGQAKDAESLLNAAPAWRDRHPSGVTALARLRAEQGAHADASRLQAQALSSWTGVPHPAHQAIAKLHAAAAAASHARRGGSGSLPKLPRLLSTTWIACDWSVVLAEADAVTGHVGLEPATKA